MDLERDQPKQQNRIKKCQFRETLTQKVKTKLYMHSKKLKLLDLKDWNFYGKKYVKEGWQRVMPYVAMGVCEQFNISRNYCPNALSTISNTSFPYLKDLSMGSFGCDSADCSIVSIEGLPFLDANNLERINLRQNMITSFKPLNKMKFSRLRYLLVSKNSSNQYGYQRILTSKISKMVYVEQLFLSPFDFEDDIEQVFTPLHIRGARYRQDYAALAKMQTEQTFINYYQNKLRIRQVKVNEAMKKKYPNSMSSIGGMVLLNGPF